MARITATDVTTHNPRSPTPGGAIARISGFKPMITGRCCDLCNANLEEGDTVQVLMNYYEDSWTPRSTYCNAHEAEAHEHGTNAVVECEVGHPVNAEFAPLYNPVVVDFEQE